MIKLGDALEEMQKLKENSIDTVITDPPYGLKFMGKKWDYDVPSVEMFKEMLRVSKPGATLLCFAGARTQHRMAKNIEEAGFILKDCIMWLYGSGFPKATDISKQVDKNNGQVRDLYKFTEWMRTTGVTSKQLNEATGTVMGSHYLTAKKQPAIPTVKLWSNIKDILTVDIPDWVNEMVERKGAERKIVGKKQAGMGTGETFGILQSEGKNSDRNKNSGEVDITAPLTPEAKLWNGWKSHGLKPAYEPIIAAIKPNDGTYADNALKWGVSGLNINGGRIGTKKITVKGGSKSGKFEFCANYNEVNQEHIGRFPSNVILDDKVTDEPWKRFFYCAKASKAERNKGCEELEEKEFSSWHFKCNICGKTYAEQKHKSVCQCENPEVIKYSGGSKNNHPTIKPLKLMEYLCTLTKTPTGGTVLDPFMGSGTTGIACKNTGRDFIGIENNEEYYKIAVNRIKSS